MRPRILIVNESSVLRTGYSTYGREMLKRFHASNKYELAELACYVEANDPRIQNLPWVVYANLPNSKNQDEINRYNSNPANQFGEWRLEEVCLDFRPHVVCIPPGELVLTNNGYIPIEQLCVEDMVATHTGSFQPIKKVFRHQHKGEIRSISFNGCTESLRLTPEHPVLVYKKRKQTNQKKSFCKIYEGINPEFVAAKDIKVGDLIVLPDLNQHQSINSVNITDYLSQFILEDDIVYTKIHNETCNKLPQNIIIDYDLGIILGYIISDGYISKYSTNVTFTGDEEHYVNEYNKLLYNKFKLTGSITKNKNKYAIDVRVNSVLLSEFLTKFNYKQYIWTNKEFVKGLIRGLVRSDGCYKKNTVSFCSIHKDLAHLFRILCWLLKIPTRLHKNTNAYEVEGYGESARKLHEICKKHTNIDTPNAKKPLKRVQHINNYLVASVTRNRSLNYYGQVYNIEVENDNSYIVQQSCVHNCDIRDYWMLSGEYRSPLRPYYYWSIMPTVDSYPQNEEWISVFKDADAVFTYQDWSYNVLQHEGGGQINLICSAPPAASEDFSPLDRNLIKSHYGLSNHKIIGTVMRNQRRKLFPDLFASFRIFLDDTQRSDILLYCHTSYPDMGWDFPRLLLKYQLTSKVLFTYICRECGYVFPQFFSDALTSCPNCHKLSAGMSNVQNGVDDRILSQIYNMFDLYLQISTCEGFGMPMVEAAACGVPIMGIDYSAMSDVIRKLGGYLLPPLTLTTELETGCFRAVSNNDILIESLKQFFDLKPEQHEQLRINTRNNYLKHYNWDITAQKWMNLFDTVDIDKYEKLWYSPFSMNDLPNDYPRNLDNKTFARWLILSTLGDPRYINSHMEARLIRDLNYGASNPGLNGMYFNENSMLFSKPNWQPFNQETAFKHFVELGKRKLHWEQQRCQK